MEKAEMHNALTAIETAASRTGLTAADLLRAISEFLCTPKNCSCNKFPADASEMCVTCQEAARLDKLAATLQKHQAA
jgi:hypothetical protein